MFTLNSRSEINLIGVNHNLVAVVRRAAEISDLEFVVIEGLRTMERQIKLKEAGASQTLNSRHLTGHAVDLAAVVDGEVRWDWPLYDYLSKVMKLAATELGVVLVWGGDWTTLKDGPHFELDRTTYLV